MQLKDINIEEKFVFKSNLKFVSLFLMLIGITAITIAFFTDKERAWANILLNNYYFLSLAIGASFFLAIQYVTQSGWSVAFKRISESLSSYIPIAGVIMIVVFLFGMKYLYPWTDAEESGIFDEKEMQLIHHKSAYLNNGFFVIRLIVFFTLWIVLTKILKHFSIKEDIEGGLKFFHKSEFYSKVLIFVLAFTFTFATIDWVMSIEPIWYSTLFAVKNFVSAFYHSIAVILLIAILLHSTGYLPFISKAHWHDFSKYLFILSIIFAYLWYSQYMIIWYANIPEETQYFIYRRENFSQTLFIVNLILNFVIPFIVLLPNYLAKKKSVLIFIALILLLGHYTDLYEQIVPATCGVLKIGFIEIGMYLGFAGLFIFLVGKTLSKINLIPQNHPYLEESLKHF